MTSATGSRQAAPPQGRARRVLDAVTAAIGFQRDRLGLLRRMAERGDVVRFDVLTQPVVLLNRPDLARALLADAARNLSKGPVLQQARIVLGEGLLTAEGAVHRRHRRLVQPAFDHRHLSRYAEVMVDAAEAEARSWGDGVRIDAAAVTHRIALQVASRCLFGADTGAQAAEVRAAVDDLLAAYPTALLPFGAALRRLPLPPVRRLRSGIERIDRLVGDLIAQRRAHGSDGDDLLSLLLAARDSQGGLNDREVRDEAVTLLLAGHETTASALAWALHHLAAAPDEQEQVRTEVERVAPGRALGFEDLDALRHTRAVVAEALRLHPPSWGIARQVRAPVVLHAHSAEAVRLAEGEVALVSPYLLHRDPRWWERPAEYVPSRWLDIDLRRGPAALLPFGAGPRRCIGESFAWMEATLVLGTLLRDRVLKATGPMPAEVASLTLRPGPAAPLVAAVHGQGRDMTDADVRNLTEEQWRERLTPQQYRVLREQGTEPAFTGAYVNTKEPGVYRCAGCSTELFTSETKYDSGSGWPSFTEPIEPGRVELREDRSHGMVRTEVICATCGGHLGHVFPDGPQPTGLRYCMNSVALELDPQDPAGA